MQKILMLSVLTMLSLCATAQQYYRWVDAEGVPHFSQNPPPGGVVAEQVVLPKLPLFSSANAAEGSPQEAISASTPTSFGTDPEFCAQITQNLDVFYQHELIVVSDPDSGDKYQLSGSERDRELIRLENMRSYYCE